MVPSKEEPLPLALRDCLVGLVVSVISAPAIVAWSRIMAEVDQCAAWLMRSQSGGHGR
jgi:hypothetical protein